MTFIELTSRRSQNVKHFLNKNSEKIRTFFSTYDQHYRDINGNWLDIDENLVDDGLDGFVKKCDKTKHIIRCTRCDSRSVRQDIVGFFCRLSINKRPRIRKCISIDLGK